MNSTFSEQPFVLLLQPLSQFSSEKTTKFKDSKSTKRLHDDPTVLFKCSNHKYLLFI